MRRILGYCIFTVLFFTSCGSQHPGETKPTLASNFLNITDNEDKGIKEITGLYGGECEYGFSKSAGINKETKNAFWLEVRKSRTIDNSKVHPELIGSNIAYLFYRNLKDGEKDKYTEIQVKAKRTNGETFDFTFPVSELELVTRRRAVVEQIYSYVKNRDFKNLGDHIETVPAITQTSPEEMVSNIKQAEISFGATKELVPYGFRFIKSNDGQELLYFAGIMLREKENVKNPFIVLLDPKANDDKIYALNYDF
ncbi:hypothetical protein V9K67_22620 [Paraflavisolibacter sp. H34]|uniref:hypothetical protein n=1 Tax=Huijunlia imazamoxiresistens TaxID=3127457 RepID=UPI003018BFC5